MKREDMYIHKLHDTREGIIFETSNIGETPKSSTIVFFFNLHPYRLRKGTRE